MTLDLLFWILMLLVGLGYGYTAWPNDAAGRPYYGGWFALWVLVLVLGIKVFGSPLK